jgi:hypothetical protein
MKPSFRTKSVTTKVTDEEYTRLEGLASASGQSMSEWVRGVLLEEKGESHERVLLGEVLGLRTILLNLLFAMAKGEPMTGEQMKTLIDTADAGKMERARKLLAPAEAEEVQP